jgi:hypothetical protein
MLRSVRVVKAKGKPIDTSPSNQTDVYEMLYSMVNGITSPILIGDFVPFQIY